MATKWLLFLKFRNIVTERILLTYLLTNIEKCRIPSHSPQNRPQNRLAGGMKVAIP